jgi:hypothetical protein
MTNKIYSSNNHTNPRYLKEKSVKYAKKSTINRFKEEIAF